MISIERLRDIREDKDYNQEYISKLIKVSRTQYSMYECGVRLIPANKLVTLAIFYKVSTDYLLNLTNERKKYKTTNNVYSTENIKMLRKNKKLKQEDIANLLKTTQEQYSKYERGVRIIPIDRLAILAEYFNVSIDYLVGLTNERKPYLKVKH